jgi:hypothetical protein
MKTLLTEREALAISKIKDEIEPKDLCADLTDIANQLFKLYEHSLKINQSNFNFRFILFIEILA